MRLISGQNFPTWVKYTLLYTLQGKHGNRSSAVQGFSVLQCGKLVEVGFVDGL
jgi:hypothetical protein